MRFGDAIPVHDVTLSGNIPDEAMRPPSARASNLEGGDADPGQSLGSVWQ